MAKRFTDNGKWADPWFGSLSAKMKVAWFFLCDQCDAVGVWKVNLPLLAFYVGESVTADEMRAAIGRRIVWLSDEKIWIPGFIPFQYGTLNPRNKAHLGMMKKIIEQTVNLPLDDSNRDLIDSFETLIRGSSEGQPTPQVKEKEKVKDKGSLRGGVGEIDSAESLKASVPIITAEKWARAYPDADWLNKQFELAYDFHVADPTQIPRNSGQWMRKLITWLEIGWEKRKRSPAVSMSDVEYDEKIRHILGSGA